MEKDKKGKIAAIEVESGYCFVENTVLKAAMLGQKEYPDQMFFFIRVGYPAVHSIKGVVSKSVDTIRKSVFQKGFLKYV